MSSSKNGDTHVHVKKCLDFLNNMYLLGAVGEVIAIILLEILLYEFDKILITRRCIHLSEYFSVLIWSCICNDVEQVTPNRV